MSTTDQPSLPAGLGTERVETLADGVFAIAMTLLVFEINVPHVAESLASSQLGSQLVALWPRLLSYVISFVVLGIYWIGHHNQFHYILRADRIFLWINILFLMCVAFIPFSAALLGQYPRQRIAVIVYGLNLIVVGLVLFLNWRYATHQRRLVDADLDRSLVRMATVRILMAPVAYTVAIALSVASTEVSIAIYLLVPLLYIVPARFDRRFINVRPGTSKLKSSE